jgi:tol-pal system protein YbgF
MLKDQVGNMQLSLDEKSASMLTLVQQTLDSVNRTNTAVAVMENRINESVKQQQQLVSAPVASVGQKLDQMAEDFRAVRESVLDMNSRIGKMDAKMADLQNLINTIQRPAACPPATETAPGGSSPGVAPPGVTPAGVTPTAATSPPAGLQADALYTNAFKDHNSGKDDIAMQEFTDYLRYFGTTQLAANAQFYIGDIYYRKKDFNNALQAFDLVLEQYSDDNKTPDAHYMKGRCLMEMGKNDSAAREFRDVINRYPDSQVAAQAKARLKDLGLSVGSAPPAKSRPKRK